MDTTSYIAMLVQLHDIVNTGQVGEFLDSASISSLKSLNKMPRPAAAIRHC
jgi:hypothetical protein